MSVSKTLFVLRHAKSSWADVGQSDYDRPLAPRGIADATKLATLLKDELIGIQLVVASSANRAAHTATIFCSIVGIPPENIVLNKNLYESTLGEMMRLVSALPADIHCAMLVGHNPTFTSFVNMFLPREIDNLPTAGLVRLDFKVDSWSHFGEKKLTSSWVDYPKNH